MLLKPISSVLLLTAGGADAFFRMQCGTPLVTDQIDPMVQPGVVPAKHVHNFMGGSALTESATYESLQNSDCTSCEVKGDKSIYWVPVLYFERESDGKFLQVEQQPGMLVYYIPEYGGDSVEVFPKGFQMVAGNPKLTNFTDASPDTEEYRRQKAIGFNCLNYAQPAEAFAALSAMPSQDKMKNCVNGLRADIQFPSCWNGENDSEDHRSHMAYPTDIEDGTCPESHPRRLITMKFETLFHVVDDAYNVPGRFVWSTGDPTGYAYHGDFVYGWEDGLLEDVVKDETCVPPERSATGGVIENCNTFTSRNLLQNPYDMNDCTIKPQAKTNFAGPIPQLPGCNPVRIGDYSSECSDEGPILPGGLSNAKASPAPLLPTPPAPPAPVVTTTRRRKHKTKKPKPSTKRVTTTPVVLPTTTMSTTTPVAIVTTSALQMVTPPVNIPAPVVTANPVMELGNGNIIANVQNVQNKQEDSVAEVIVTVLETVTATVYDGPAAVKTVSVYSHRRRHNHRRGF